MLSEQLQDGHINVFGRSWQPAPLRCAVRHSPTRHELDHSQAEKEELVALKNSAPEVDADEESRARLAALRGEDAGPKKAVDLPFRTAQVRAFICVPEVRPAIDASYTHYLHPCRFEGTL